MVKRLGIRRRGIAHSAFTLIELLVVVAIIALLISILLPSLSRARSQARATLCATRLAQLTRAQLTYADDYDETPPFVGCGFGAVGEDARHYTHLEPDDARNSEYAFARHESWLFPGRYYVDDDVWLHPYWPDLPNGGPSPREGTLYTYTRFVELYRCPAFERVPVGAGGHNGSSKTQNTFNFTRTVAGRKMLCSISGIEDPPAVAAGEPVLPGPIMKISAVYASSSMGMLLDEQWDFHCAGNYDDGGTFGIGWTWMAAENINGLLADMVGSYHGTTSRVLNSPDWDMLLSSKTGNVGYYDGHVDLYRDPWPWCAVGEGYSIFDLLNQLVADIDGDSQKALSLLLTAVYAQRGMAFSTDQLLELVQAMLDL